MKQSNTEELNIPKTFSNNKKIITNQKDLAMFIATYMSNIKVMLIEIKSYQSENTLMKLNLT